MWGCGIKKPKQRNVFREFKGELMIVGIKDEDDIERKIMSDMIAVVASK